MFESELGLMAVQVKAYQSGEVRELGATLLEWDLAVNGVRV